MRNAALALALSLLAPAVTRASITYQYVTDQTSYSAAAGNLVSVSIFLQETVTGSSQSLLTQTPGLFSYAYYVTQTGGPSAGQSTIGSYTSAAPFTGSHFSSSSGSLPPNSFDFAALPPTGSTSGPTGSVTGQGVRQILLGTLTINAGATTQFTLQSVTHSPGDSAAAGADGNTLTFPNNPGQFYDLDLGGTQNGSAGTVTFNGADALTYTFTVGPSVPEPGSLTLALVAAAGTAAAAWRRRRATA
jgi:hypothetical protein